MLTRMAARQWPMSKKNGQIMIGHYLNTVGEPHSEKRMFPVFFELKINHTPSAVIKRGGRVGLSSVQHGKLIAYKIFNFIVLQ